MSGYFMGLYDALPENKLQDNEFVAAHLIHSLMHIAREKRSVYCTSSMTVNDFYEANQEYLESVRRRYKNERYYSIPDTAVKKGIEWFLEHHVEL